MCFLLLLLFKSWSRSVTCSLSASKIKDHRSHHWLGGKPPQMMASAKLLSTSWPTACTGARAHCSPVAGISISLCSHDVPVHHFSSLSRSLQMAPHPSGLPTTRFTSAQFAALLSAHFVSFPRSFLKMLNNICASIDPWDTSLVTGLQLDFLLLMATFEPSSLASFQLTSLSIHLVYIPSACLWGFYDCQCRKPH